MIPKTHRRSNFPFTRIHLRTVPMTIPGVVPAQAIPAKMLALVPTHTITSADIVSTAQKATIQRSEGTTETVSLGMLYPFLFTLQFGTLPGNMAAKTPLTKVFGIERTRLLTASGRKTCTQNKAIVRSNKTTSMIFRRMRLGRELIQVTLTRQRTCSCPRPLVSNITLCRPVRS